MRSYDAKSLYHHPELAVTEHTFIRTELRRFAQRPDIPVHVLYTESGGVAFYALHYDRAFVQDPIRFQLRTAGELLFSGRKAMTLFFMTDDAPDADYRVAAVARVVLRGHRSIYVQRRFHSVTWMAGVPAAPGTVRAHLDAAPVAPRVARWIAPWAWVTLTVAGAATIFDAVLLQYRRSYFTGGFLATDYVTSASEAVAFFVGSFFADVAVVGVITWTALWLLGRLAVPRHLALGAVLVLAFVPVLVVNFIEYQLLTYLGDAFDLRLLFDLAGRDPGELVAVSSAHMTRVIWLATGIGVATILATWFVLRRLAARKADPVPAPSSWRSMLIPVAICLAGAVVTTLLRSGSDVLDNGLRRKPTGRFWGSCVGRRPMSMATAPAPWHVLAIRICSTATFDRTPSTFPATASTRTVSAGDLPSDCGAVSRSTRDGRRAWGSKPDVVLDRARELPRGSYAALTSMGSRSLRCWTPWPKQGIAPRLAYSHNGYTVQSRRHIFSGSVADVRGSSDARRRLQATGLRDRVLLGSG